MLKHEKANLLSSFKEEISKANIILLLEHAKLPFEAFDKARREADSQTKIIKVKNRIAKLAFENTSYKPLNDFLKNERLLIISDDLLKACHSAKFFLDYAKATGAKDSIKISLGAGETGVFEESLIIEVSKVKSAEELRSRLLRVIKVVAENMLRAIQARCDAQSEN